MIANARVGDSSMVASPPGLARYVLRQMRDVVFLLAVFGFFAIAVAFMRACGIVVRETSADGRDQ
jgi:hypothetical protein